LYNTKIDYNYCVLNFWELHKTDEEKQAETEKAKEVIKEFCAEYKAINYINKTKCENRQKT
jgi:hypothetical protein